MTVGQIIKVSVCSWLGFDMLQSPSIFPITLLVVGGAVRRSEGGVIGIKRNWGGI